VNVIDERRFAVLCEAGEIVHESCEFLDGIKIGLHVNGEILQAPDVVDPSSIDASLWKRHRVKDTRLHPSQFFLATTRERIAISSRIFGQLHTRSKWARLGLDCVGSSHYVSPGFGAGRPTPVVLELAARVTIELPQNEPLAALILFELEHPVRSSQNDPLRFPLGSFYSNER
jgi:deoxycytidine triphosphate deaminase